MKKLLYALLLALPLGAIGQTFSLRTNGTFTPVDPYVSVPRALYIPRNCDTANALHGGKDTIGAIIWDTCNHKLWVRDTTAGGHKWSGVSGAVANANNGLSKSGDTIQLGQAISAVGSPAALNSNRELPLNGNEIRFIGNGKIKTKSNDLNSIRSNASLLVHNDTIPGPTKASYLKPSYAWFGPMNDTAHNAYSTSSSDAYVGIVSYDTLNTNSTLKKRLGFLNDRTIVKSNPTVPGGAVVSAFGGMTRLTLMCGDSMIPNPMNSDLIWAHGSLLQFKKIAGYTGRTVFASGQPTYFDASTAQFNGLYVNGNGPGDYFYLRRTWASSVNYILGQSVNDTVENYIGTLSTGFFEGKIKKAYYFVGGPGLPYYPNGSLNDVDSLWAFAFDETRADGYLNGKFGIGIRSVPYGFYNNRTEGHNKDSLPTITTLTNQCVRVIDTLTGQDKKITSSNLRTAINAPGVSTGTAPPATTPTRIGDMFVDTSAKKVYVATGTASSADWTILN